MSQDLSRGSRWASVVDETEVIVMKVGTVAVTLECGGHEMVQAGMAKPAGLTMDPALSAGTLVGKRYADQTGLEVLCTHTGSGTLSADGIPLRPTVTRYRFAAPADV